MLFHSQCIQRVTNVLYNSLVSIKQRQGHQGHKISALEMTRSSQRLQNNFQQRRGPTTTKEHHKGIQITSLLLQHKEMRGKHRGQNHSSHFSTLLLPLNTILLNSNLVWHQYFHSIAKATTAHCSVSVQSILVFQALASSYIIHFFSCCTVFLDTSLSAVILLITVIVERSDVQFKTRN